MQSPPKKPKSERPKHPLLMKRRVAFSLGLPLWVFLGFMLAQAIVLAVIAAMQAAGVSFENVNVAVFNATGGAIIYALSIGLVIGLPWLVKKRKTTRDEVGLGRWPKWMDIIWAIVAMVVYVFLTSIVVTAASQLLTFIDYDQAQDTGFLQVTSQLEYVLAFLTLVVMAPVAEEVLFRGYLFGKLRKYASLWVSILITSLLFAIVHFQWNVGIDVFVLSIVLCLLRVYTGSLWASILLHMLKNGVAFYFLFINPSLL